MFAAERPPLDGSDLTDYSRWRLKTDDNGVSVWWFLKMDEELESWPQTAYDKHCLGLEDNSLKLDSTRDPFSAARNGFHFFRALQAPEGHWPNGTPGLLFFVGFAVIALFIADMRLEEEEKKEIIRYLFNTANPEEGGWGFHLEGPPTVFGTSLNYVALRLLGVSPDHSIAAKARAKLHELGGATHAPSWPKFFLSLLNVYDWEGNNPILPELWSDVPVIARMAADPSFSLVGIHPFSVRTDEVNNCLRSICFSQVFPSYLYGLRFQLPESPLILSLRKELYVEDYYKIDWPEQRNRISTVDCHCPHTKVLDFVMKTLSVYEMCAIPLIRQKSLDVVYQIICCDDENTLYRNNSNASKLLNIICRAVTEGKESHAFKMHQLKRREMLFMSPYGMLVSSIGADLWETTFVVQALVETGLAEEEENRQCCLKALDWIDKCQLQNNPTFHKQTYRHATKGAWPLANKEEGYAVSDCTGEALKAVLYLQKRTSYAPQIISDQRLIDAVDNLLSFRNSDGGFPTYERSRASSLLEYLNPSDTFGQIMVDHSSTECTSSVLTALGLFKSYYPAYRRNEIDETIEQGVEYIHKVQHPNGGWVGNWGICFTYGTMFALNCLAMKNETYFNSKAVEKACNFLVSKQRPDGGWGENYKACEVEQWIDEDTQVVQTAWGILALIYGRYPERAPIERGIALIMSRQLFDGSWAQEKLEGSFCKTGTLNYRTYKFTFPIWALGKASHYLQEIEDK